MTTYNLAINTDFWAWSKFNSFANFGPLITNTGAFESPHQGKVILGYLAEVRNNCKNKLLVQGK